MLNIKSLLKSFTNNVNVEYLFFFAQGKHFISQANLSQIKTVKKENTGPSLFFKKENHILLFLLSVPLRIKGRAPRKYKNG